MNRELSKVLTYVKMCLLLMVLAGTVILIAGTPLASYIIARSKMVMIQGAPQYPNLYEANQSEQLVSNGSMDLSEILKPELDTQYATITCESIELEVPLYYGDSETSLGNGAGQYAKSGFPGEGEPILISGHDATFFAPLEKIEAGDTVTISTLYGNYDYKVTGTRVADKTDTTAYNLEQKKEELILYTCYPFGKLTGDRSDRFFVYCDRVSETEDVQ